MVPSVYRTPVHLVPGVPRRQSRRRRGQHRRRAATYGYSPAEREGADASADYLIAKRPYLDCYTALANGWPVATWGIEGARRYLVKDRMDITGAR